MANTGYSGLPAWVGLERFFSGEGSFVSRISSVAVWFTANRVDRLEILVVRFSGALREARGPVWFVGFSCECVV